MVNDSYLAEYSPLIDNNSPTSSLTEFSDTAASPPNPEMIDQEFGIYSHARVGSENGHMDELENGHIDEPENVHIDKPEKVKYVSSIQY